MIHLAIWVVSALFIFWFAMTAWSFVTRRNQRRALRRLRDAHANLSPEQKADETAQRVEWYLNLPEGQQTVKTWESVQPGTGDPPSINKRMKSFFATCRIYIFARLIRWHYRRCAVCAAASSKGDDMRYEEFCPRGLKLIKAVEKILVPRPQTLKP